MKTIYIDGGCSNNGQRDISIREMISVVTDDEGVVLADLEGFGGSNNIAELIALREAIIWAIKEKLDEVCIISDSKNTLAWYRNGVRNKKINDYERTVAILEEIKTLRKLISIDLKWLPREENLAGHYIENKYHL